MIKENDPARDAACEAGPGPAYTFALNVDKGPHDATRKASIGHQKYSFLYGREIDKCPRDDTRTGACDISDIVYADMSIRYALEVDKCPHDDTRDAACRGSGNAVIYAELVDKCARDDTRLAACKNQVSGFNYAERVDKGPHKDTREAMRGDPHWVKRYKREIDDEAEPERLCCNCDSWGNTEGQGWGLCRRRPPQHVDEDGNSVWPTTGKNDWCGAFYPRESEG